MKKALIIISTLLVVLIAVVFLLILLRPKKALLAIESTPVASIAINGQTVGQTPMELEIRPGEVTLELTAGESSYKTRINLSSGVTTIVKRRLSKDLWEAGGEILTFRRSANGRPSITVVTTPDGAKVALDRLEYTSPITVSPASVGNHILKVSQNGFESFETVVQIVDGYDLTAFIDLVQEVEPRRE